MKAKDVKIGEVYTVKVSGQPTDVVITATSPYGGWIGINQKTRREVRFKTAGRLRSHVNADHKAFSEGMQSVGLTSTKDPISGKTYWE